MSGKAPEVSVVIPCHNAEAFVGEAVGSALGQVGVRHEVIVVDDGSTDASAEILASFGGRITLIRQENRGRSAARNRGLEVARGEFVAFLDADDWWDPEFLRTMVAALRETGCGLAYCGWKNEGLEGPRGEPFVPPDYEGAGKVLALLENARWPVHAAVVRTDLARLAGGFPEDLERSEDFGFWLEVATRTRLARVPRVLAFYRHHRQDHLSTAEAGWALAHLEAQKRFLKRHPGLRDRLGRAGVRRVLYGELRRRAYVAYWGRDLRSARRLFRRLLAAGYLRRGDLRRMLPALLPEPVHRWMVGMADRHREVLA